MVRPATLWPSRLSNAATVELSTPPDIATAIRSAIVRAHCRRDPAQMCDAGFDRFDQSIDLFFRVLGPERKTHAGARFLRRQAHGEQNVRWLDSAAGTGRTAGYRVAA